ncbi:MAG: glycosyltransferase family 2 protein [Desulfatibacillum sp.]|nr:glycosyltransferase family 2 protein [Desulfatibacillum sp.]
MQFTIAICTHNRDYILEQSVRAALAQDYARGFEVLVVDNKSTDNTPQVIRALLVGNSRLRAVGERRQGLSHARNRAIAEARGKFLIFVDDDAALCPEYLARLDRVFQEVPDAGSVGGPISLGWLGPRPSWYETGLDIWCNRLDHGPLRCFLKYPKILYGTNMAFPKKVLEGVGGFHTGLGRSGKGLADSEDLEIMLRIARAGPPIVYDPGLSVTHYITEDRLSRDYLLEKAAVHGRFRCVAEAMHGRANPLPSLGAWMLSLARSVIQPRRRSLSEKLIRRASLFYLKQWVRSR